MSLLVSRTYDHLYSHGKLASDWHEFFLADAFFVSGKSKDRSTKCGCVVTTKDHDVLVRGWNDHPRGIKDLDVRRERPEKYVWTEHAERNAIYNAARIGVSLKGGTIYVNRVPCPDCARAIIQSGIDEIVTTMGDDEDAFAERMNTKTSMLMMSEADIKITLYEPSIHNKLKRFRFERGL
jgi:dCMP deaminase